jgi:hypothetical protein
MRIPGFHAELSFDTIVPAFCYCDCRLIRTCIPIGPAGVPFCYYRQLCVPRGHCPPNYCSPG